MTYEDQLLDMLGDITDHTIHELYCENKILEVLMMTPFTFEDIYYSLFEDNPTVLENAEDIKYNVELYEDYNERIDVLYEECLCHAMHDYSYVRFLAEIPKSQWNQIIHENLELKRNWQKDKRVFEIYRTLHENFRKWV